jgi:hypothetical protein
MCRDARLTVVNLLAAVLVVALCPVCQAQTGSAINAPLTSIASGGTIAGPWEVTLEGRVGFPVGHLKVGEFPTGINKAGGGGTPGTLLQLHTLGIDRSEVIEATAAYHFTPRDAVRAGFLYYFLDGTTTIHGPSIVYNGQEFTAGSLDTNGDFYRLSLDYERTLLGGRNGEQELIGSVGFTYVSINPKLTGSTTGGGAEAHGKSNSEDFFRQELPVPILGLRWTYPLSDRWFVRAAISGGFLPRVDSLRTEGGTIYLEQRHADVGLGAVYRLSHIAELEAGYHFSYLFQKELSHEDKNVFELFDNGFQVRLGLRF